MFLKEPKFSKPVFLKIQQQKRGKRSWNATKLQSEEKSNNTGNRDHGIRMDDPNPSQTPKKPYQRYSSQQVLRMREFYRKNTHPNDNERKAIGQELGLDPLRVKFWFQNRRSHNKKKDDKVLNKQLREANEKLCVDNGMLKYALGFPICKNCNGPSTNEMSATRMELLRAENAFIKEEIHWVTHIIEKYCESGVRSCPLHVTVLSAGASDVDNGHASSSAAQDESPAGEVLECNE